MIISYDDLAGQQSNVVIQTRLLTDSLNDSKVSVVAPALPADDDLSLNAMTYVAGYVCRRVLFRHNCETC